ncbi:MAG: 6-phosphofructokinase [Elusimicrobia bacterium]|nr:6-phosphofructokinase [Elusimicrobiota bacterium]
MKRGPSSSQRIGILTGGGDCPGLNPAIRGCVLRALDHGWECVGILEGWKGLIEGHSTPLGIAEVDDLMGRGGTILRTSRTNPYKKEGAVARCLATIKRLRLGALVAMGGEDTLGVAARLFKDYRLKVVGVPKTMDNDLSATDYTFGFDSAVTIAVEAAERLKDTGRSHRRIMILEVMGRHAGWVALYTALASGADGVLIPEEPVSLSSLVADLRAVYRRRQTALLIISEGVSLPDKKAAAGREGGGQEALDEFGHMLLKERGTGEQIADYLEQETGIETRVAVIGHIQRGGPPTVFDRILAVRTGVKAIDFIAEGQFGQMVAVQGTKLVGVPLAKATGQLKLVSQDWLALIRALQK